MTVVVMSHGELSRHDTLLRFERGELRIEDAAMLLGVCRRQVYRLLDRLRADGPEGLVSWKRVECLPLSPPDTTPTSRPNISNSSTLESPPRSPSQPSCGSSWSPPTHSSKPIDAGRNLRLDHLGYSRSSSAF